MPPSLKAMESFFIGLLNPLFAGVRKWISDGVDKVVDSVDKIPNAVANGVVQGNELHARALSRVAERIEKAVEKIKNPTFSGEVKIDNTDIVRELKGVVGEIKKLSSTSGVDTMPLERQMHNMCKAVEAGNAKQDEIAKGLNAMAQALGGIKLDMPKSWKLDDAQFQTLANANAVAGPGTTPLNMATRISNTTVSATDTSTEYSYTFPAGTVGWLIKTRDQGTLGYYSWTTGKLPSSGDGSTYMTIPQNFLRSQQDVEYAGKTIYLGADTASTIFEIEVFKR